MATSTASSSAKYVKFIFTHIYGSSEKKETAKQIYKSMLKAMRCEDDDEFEFILDSASKEHDFFNPLKHGFVYGLSQCSTSLTPRRSGYIISKSFSHLSAISEMLHLQLTTASQFYENKIASIQKTASSPKALMLGIFEFMDTSWSPNIDRVHLLQHWAVPRFTDSEIDCLLKTKALKLEKSVDSDYRTLNVAAFLLIYRNEPHIVPSASQMSFLRNLLIDIHLNDHSSNPMDTTLDVMGDIDYNDSFNSKRSDEAPEFDEKEMEQIDWKELIHEGATMGLDDDHWNQQSGHHPLDMQYLLKLDMVKLYCFLYDESRRLFADIQFSSSSKGKYTRNAVNGLENFKNLMTLSLHNFLNHEYDQKVIDEMSSELIPMNNVQCNNFGRFQSNQTLKDQQFIPLVKSKHDISSLFRNGLSLKEQNNRNKDNNVGNVYEEYSDSDDEPIGRRRNRKRKRGYDVQSSSEDERSVEESPPPLPPVPTEAPEPTLQPPPRKRRKKNKTSLFEPNREIACGLIPKMQEPARINPMHDNSRNSCSDHEHSVAAENGNVRHRKGMRRKQRALIYDSSDSPVSQ